MFKLILIFVLGSMFGGTVGVSVVALLQAGQERTPVQHRFPE